MNIPVEKKSSVPYSNFGYMFLDSENGNALTVAFQGVYTVVTVS